MAARSRRLLEWMRPIVTKLAVTAVAVAAIGFLVHSSIANGQRMDNVDDLTAAGDFARWDGTEMKVAGWIQAGSIVEKVVAQETYRTFVVRGLTGRKMRVFSSGPKPDTFRDNSEVVATGFVVPATRMQAAADRLDIKLTEAAGYVVDASDLSAKCPSKYEGMQAGSAAKQVLYRP